MKTNANDMTMQIDSGGVEIQSEDWAGINVAHIRFPKGADATPLLEGLPGNLCAAPHWGYVLRGSIHVRFADGSEETVRAGEAYYWPPGHTVWLDEDYESIEFSPSEEMRQTIAHLARKMGLEEQPSPPM